MDYCCVLPQTAALKYRLLFVLLQYSWNNIDYCILLQNRAQPSIIIDSNNYYCTLLQTVRTISIIVALYSLGKNYRLLFFSKTVSMLHLSACS